MRHPITAAALLGLSAVTTFINYCLIKNESKHSASPRSTGERSLSNPAPKRFIYFCGTSPTERSKIMWQLRGNL